MADDVFTPEKRAQFLHELGQIPNVVRACRKVGISRRRAYQIREDEPDFKELWDEALKEGLESIEAEMHRRAYEGIPGKPVLDRDGAVVREMVEYSDTLAIFLAKAHAPEKYRERQDINVSGSIDVVGALTAARRRVGKG